MLRTRDLLRRAGITAPVYATVEHKTARLLADLDIVQLHRPTRDLRAAAGRAEVHSYFTRHDGLLQSPHRYYRTQGWQAHALDLKGIGVWALWDSTGAADPESGWDMFVGGRERDFGLLYQGRDGCARPSRRLLAWRRGIEEHRLLRACVRTDAHRQIVDQAIATGNTATVRTALDTLTRNCQ